MANREIESSFNSLVFRGMQNWTAESGHFNSSRLVKSLKVGQRKVSVRKWSKGNSLTRKTIHTLICKQGLPLPHKERGEGGGVLVFSLFSSKLCICVWGGGERDRERRERSISQYKHWPQYSCKCDGRIMEKMVVSYIGHICDISHCLFPVHLFKSGPFFYHWISNG